jgi:hypothetical protein
MHIRGINPDTLAAQAQYAEWRKRLQETQEQRAAVKPKEADEHDETGHSADEEDQDQGQPEAESNASQLSADDKTVETSAESVDEDDGREHLRSFA